MNTRARKVMIIGTGNVGASAAYALLNQNIAEELILVDLNRDRVEGHVQDLADAAAYMPGMMHITHRDAADCADVDIAVITVSGGPLKPGQTRLDELQNTARIVKNIVPQMMENGFNGIFLIATNPCDIITWQVWKLSGLPRSQVIGTGVWLDTTRLRRAGADAGYRRAEYRCFYPWRAWRHPVSGVVALVGLRFADCRCLEAPYRADDRF
jgi:L-lactate dehydrogenase